MGKRIEQIKKFCVTLLKRCGVKKYRTRFSKKIFSQHDWFVMLVLKEVQSRSYREFVDWLKPEDLNIMKAPHFTSPHKASQRFENSVIALLVEQCISLLRKKAYCVGVDSTGFSLNEGSSYYTTRCAIIKKRRKYLKLSVACELNSQLVLSTSIHKAWRHDNKDFKMLLSKLKGKKLCFVAADKAYDSEENRRYITEELNTKPQIPLKRWSKIRGVYRRKNLKTFNIKKYHQRSKIETVFSVMKRLYKPVIKAKTITQQRKELLLKVLAYNIRRLSKITFILWLKTEDIYTALKFQQNCYLL